MIHTKSNILFNDQENLSFDKQRLAIFDTNLVTIINKLKGKKVIWLHAASIGETKNALKLIVKIYPKLKNHHIIITSTSTSVKKLVSNLAFDKRGIISFQVLPYDTTPYIKKFIDVWQPNIVIWNEQDVWPNILLYLRSQNNIKKILIQGRLSARSYKLWKLIGSDIFAMFFDKFSHVYIQNSDSLERFCKLGVNDAKFAGNLKYFPLNKSITSFDSNGSDISDRLIFQSNFYKILQKNLETTESVQFVSTHKEDDSLILSVINSYFSKIDKNQLKILIAPRHPDKISGLLEKLTEKKVKFFLLSDLINNQNSTTKQIESAQVIVWNKIGMIESFYKLKSKICIIGGSFGKKLGGHNPFEPLIQNKFIIFGKDMANFPEILSYKDNELVNQIQTQDKIAEVINKLLKTKQPKAQTNNFLNSDLYSDLLNQLERLILE